MAVVVSAVQGERWWCGKVAVLLPPPPSSKTLELASVQNVDMGVADGQDVGREGHVGRETHGVAERGRKRRGAGEYEGGAGAWRLCALGPVGEVCGGTGRGCEN